jgi:prephenate dehydratase
MLIAFQGVKGAYSDLACRAYAPDAQTLPCETFEATMDAVREGRADLAMLPCENSLAGRVPDIHALLPESGLFIVGEQFQRVEHCLLAPKGATLQSIRRVHSHPVALRQIRGLLRELDVAPVVQADTAGAAEMVAQWNNPEEAAVASSLAAEIYGLTILRENVEDAAHNTTRFYIASTKPQAPDVLSGDVMTTFIFRVRNIPAALYKALGGFATNGVNMTRLESYMVDGEFAATQFLCDIEGHPNSNPIRSALDELAFFSQTVRVLGVYERDRFRNTHG